MSIPQESEPQEAPASDGKEMPDGKQVRECKDYKECKEVAPTAPEPQPQGDDGWAVWAKEDGNFSRNNDTVSRSYDMSTWEATVGADKRVKVSDDWTAFFGLTGNYLTASRSFDPGSGNTDGYGGGLYTTWFRNDGWYADMYGKYMNLHNRFNTQTSDFQNSSGQYSVNAFDLSLEGGKRFDFRLWQRKFFIEPEAQLMQTWIGGARYTASNGLNINAGSQQELIGRLGARLGMHFENLFTRNQPWEPYVRADLFQRLTGSGLITTDQTTFSPRPGYTTAQVGLGVTIKLTSQFIVFGEATYLFGDGLANAIESNVGLRYVW